jgi:phosphatidate cytidylyltransferase
MLQRSKSAVGIVLAGIIPAIFGGPIFAAVFTVICLIAYYEYLLLARRVGTSPVPAGFAVIPLFALTALLNGGPVAVLGMSAAAIAIPITAEISQTDLTGSFLDWGLASLGGLYLGIPAFAAISLRQLDGNLEAGWLETLARWTSLGWSDDARGLAWLLLALLVTWLSDTGAYLFGKSVGRRPLIPHVSPNKTWEGLIGGLACAAGTGALAVWLFGLDLNPLAGAGIGLIIGVVGVIGDLAESVIKRQAGVKDSGTLIPGHGGMLDRLDALLFTFPAGLFIATIVDRFVT